MCPWTTKPPLHFGCNPHPEPDMVSESNQILLGGLIMRMRSLTALRPIVNKYKNLISCQYSENQIGLEN